MAADALWAYCVARAGTPLPADAVPVAAGRPLEWIEAGGLAALVSAVPLDEFGEEPLRRNLNDLAWLERVARAHERVLESTLAHGTTVPLRMCTIFADRGGVARTLAEQHATFSAALVELDGREEWAVKVVVDREALEASAGAGAAHGASAAPGSGAAYLQRRRLEREQRETADELATGLAETLHRRLSGPAVDAVVNRPQNRRLSGHEGQMILNGAYLVERERAAELQQLVAELRARHAPDGVRLELTGPLPPFNFARAS